jgi:hypothetical protein
MKEEVEPIRTAATIVFGAFKWGFGISSTMCETASYPVSPKEPVINILSYVFQRRHTLEQS